MKKQIGLKLITLLIASVSLFGCSSKENNSNAKKEVVIMNVDNIPISSSLVDIISKVKPSVVDVYAYGNNFTSAGSGVIVAKSETNYYVVTNHHVIDKAKTFEVTIYFDEVSNANYSATLIGTSLKNDVAILSFTCDKEISCANFIDDSTNVKVGQEVIAIGNPLGILGGSVTHGIISATQRDVYLKDIGYMELFQTDAAINSGNSGGALFTNQGTLIGIVNSGYSDYEGLNFAIPSNTVKNCVESIINTYSSSNSLGYVEGENNLGISFSNASVFTNSELASQIDVVYVKENKVNSDAEKAKILSFADFLANKTSSFYRVKKINDIEIDSYQKAEKIIYDLKSLDTISFVFEEISRITTGGFFQQSNFYLTGNEIKMDISLTQYVYSI